MGMGIPGQVDPRVGKVSLRTEFELARFGGFREFLLRNGRGRFHFENDVRMGNLRRIHARKRPSEAKTRPGDFRWHRRRRRKS